MPTVHMNRFELEFILNHARSTYPEECCGFLLGLDTKPRQILRAIPADNTNQNSRRTRYDIEPIALMKADEEARRLRLELIGVYHSHPDATVQPSRVDLDHAWPWYTYLILSVTRGEPGHIGAWSLNQDRSKFNHDELLIVD